MTPLPRDGRGVRAVDTNVLVRVLVDDVDEKADVDAALKLFQASSADFANCLILVGAGARKREPVTFDWKLVKLDRAKSVSEELNPMH